MDFIEVFDMHLRIEKKHKPGTRLKYFKCLKAIMNAAVRRGTLPYNPFKGYEAEQPDEKKRYLSIDEIKSIMSVQLDKPNQKFTMDMFIFLCFTGICYCDLCNLKHSNLFTAEDGSLWIRTVRQKTGTAENVRLMDIAIRIIRKYEGMAAGERLFPMLTHGSITLHLKKIAALCGIRQNVTFHMARHSFATLVCLGNGVPIETISQMMGHRSIRTTQIYAEITGQKVSHDMEKLADSLNNIFSMAEEEQPPVVSLRKRKAILQQT